MPIQTSWHTKDQVILLHTSGQVTFADLLAADEIVSKMMSESKSDYVHIICDLSDVDTLPPPQDFQLGHGDTWVRHPKRGWFLTVGIRNPVIRMTVSVVLQAFNVRFKSFDSLQGAEWFLNDLILSEWAIPA